MPWESDQFACAFHDACDDEIEGIELSLAYLRIAEIAAPASPHAAGEIGGDVFGEAEDLCDLADSTARTIVDDGRGECGAVMAVPPVDILDHFLAPLMLEIDVDVG